MTMTSVYTIAAVIGDGTSENPRNASMWGRLDNVLSIIDTGDFCLKSDGTVDVSLISQINVSMSLVEDFGPCGIVVQHMEESAFKLAVDYLQSQNGYVMLGESIDELKVSLENAKVFIMQKIDEAGINLPNGATLFDSIQTYFTAPRFAGEFIGSGLLVIRAYYKDRLAGATVEHPEALSRLNGTLDPVRFRLLKNTFEGAGRTEKRKVLHDLYDLACIDLVLRNMQ